MTVDVVNTSFYTFEFAYDTPGLDAGIPAFVPEVDDVLLDAWFELVTPWDGTTPQGDIGTLTGPGWAGTNGMFSYVSNPISMAEPADVENAGAGLLMSDNMLALSAAQNIGMIQRNLKVPAIASVPSPQQNGVVVPVISGARLVPSRFVAQDPLKVVVSRDGTTTGGAPGATQGEAILHLILAHG